MGTQDYGFYGNVRRKIYAAMALYVQCGFGAQYLKNL